MTIYQVRHKATGLFSTGGQCPVFNRYGKTWGNLGHVKSHLTMHRNNVKSGYSGSARRSAEYLASVEIVKYATTDPVCLDVQVMAS